jgi:hypothetical protein
MVSEHVWTYKYENDGNGFFAEWWALFRDGERIGRISTSEDDAKMAVDRLNATERLMQTIGFFASVIKSGEPWTEACEKAYADISEGK